MKIYYTKKEYDELLSHAVILIDTQEKSNKEIVDWFCENNIKYVQINIVFEGWI